MCSAMFLPTKKTIIMPGIIKTVLSIFSFTGPEPNSTILLGDEVSHVLARPVLNAEDP